MTGPLPGDIVPQAISQIMYNHREFGDGFKTTNCIFGFTHTGTIAVLSIKTTIPTVLQTVFNAIFCEVLNDNIINIHFSRNGELLFMRFIYFECDGNHNDTTLVNSYSIDLADFRRLSQWAMPNKPTNAYQAPSKSEMP